MFYFIILEDNKEFNDSIYRLLEAYKIQNKLNYKISRFYDYNNELQSIINDDEYYKIYIFDIELPHVSGIHIATKIRDFDLTSLIILLTAHKKEYQDQMIEDRIMYLKCISKQDNWQQKIIEILEGLNIQSKYRHILRINTKECLYRLQIDKIVYIKFEDRHSIFHMNYGTSHPIPRTLKEVKDMLDPRFMYCYKSCIINTQCIEKINKKERHITMIDGTVITDVSLAYLKQIAKCI